MPSTSETGERGYALVAVIGILAVLSVIAVSLSQRVRLDVSTATSFLEETRDQYAIESGTSSAIRALSKEPDRAHGRELHLDMTKEMRHLDILISDESQKTDINRASSEELLRAFMALGADQSSAEALSHRVVDWRDEDDRPQRHGGEIGDYLAAGALAIPRNESFASLEEAEAILGLPIEIGLRLHEEFTLIPKIPSGKATFGLVVGAALETSREEGMISNDARSSDGITRRADSGTGPDTLGLQIKLRRASEVHAREYFRLLLAGEI